MTRERKASLRRALLAARRAISAKERAVLDGTLVRRIAALDSFFRARALIGYWPTKGEIDLTPLFEIAKAEGKPIYLPRCAADGMRFYRYEGADALSPDRFGIPAPAPEAELPADTADTLCILPGLAADKAGHRLGYGGGFYDRFLPHFNGETLFALYDRFLVDELPHEPHDMPVTHIVTEKGEYRYGKMDTAAPTV